LVVTLFLTFKTLQTRITTAMGHIFLKKHTLSLWFWLKTARFFRISHAVRTLALLTPKPQTLDLSALSTYLSTVARITHAH
jgi:hypothetical protein